jgi:AsmA protein
MSLIYNSIRMKLSKNKRRWIIGTSSVIALLLIIPYIILQFYKDEIKAAIEKEIDTNLNAVITFQEINFSFISEFPRLTVYMNDMDVLGVGEFEKDTLACIKRVDLELDWYKLIVKNEMELNRVFFNDPIIHFLILKNGHANYDIVKGDTLVADTTDNSSISLNRFVIKRGSVTYQDQTSNLFFEMDGIDHVGKIDYSKEIVDYITDTEVKRFSLRDDKVEYLYNKEIKIDMNIEMNLKTNSFRFKENTFGVNKFIFGIDGQVGMLPNGYDLDLKFASKETSFSDILSLVPSTYGNQLKEFTTEGSLNFNGFIKGKYFDTSDVMPAFHVDINVIDAMLKLKDIETKAKDIQFQLIVDNEYGIMDSTIFDLRKLNMDLGGYPVKGRFKSQGFDVVKLDADLLAEVELAQLEKIYPIKGFDISGKLNFELKAKGVYKEKFISKKSVIESIPAFKLNLTLSDGLMKYDSAHATFHDIQLFLTAQNQDGNPEHTNVNLKELEMYLGKNLLTGNVFIEGFKSYYIKSDLKANMNLADIGSLYPNNNIIKGVFSADIKLDGRYDAEKKLLPAINASVKLTNGYLKTPNYPEPIENVSVTATAVNTTGKAEDTRVNIDQLNLLMEGQPFAIKGYIEDFVKMNYDLSIKGILDLDKITKVYPIEGIQLKGLVATDVESRGSILDLENQNYSNIYCVGTVELKRFKYASASLSVPLFVKDALFRLTPSKIIMDKCIGKLGKTKFQLTGDVTNYMYFVTANNDMITGDLKLISDTLDLTPWIDTTPSNTVGNAASTVSSGSSTATTTTTGAAVWEVPKNINFVFDSDIANVYYEDLHITGLKGEITIRNGILTLDETGFNSMNAFFSIDGDYNTQDMQHPKFDVTLNIKELDINRAYKEIKLVRKLAPAAGDTYGKMTINYKLAGELNKDGTVNLGSLNGAGNITIANAKINGMKMFDEISKSAKKQEVKDPDLKNFSMDSEIHDNRLYVKPFSLKINGLNTDIEGSNDVYGGSLNYIVKIELIPIDKMKIPFHVTGTYDNPKVAMGKGKKEDN